MLFERHRHPILISYGQGIAAQALGGTEWGIRIILLWSMLGVLFLCAATYVKGNQAHRDAHN